MTTKLPLRSKVSLVLASVSDC